MATRPNSIFEAARLQALSDLEVLDSAAEPEFDALVKAASLICDTPISLVSLVDENRQWFKANIGLQGATETPRDIAFCSHAILDDELMEIPDATLDSRFYENPLVTGSPDIRFYAGAPLRLSNGARVGTLCVIDRQPRRLNDTQREALRHLATSVVKALEGRLATRRVASDLAKLQSSESNLRLIIDSSPSMMAYWGRDLKCRFVNRAYEHWFGVDSTAMVGSDLGNLLGTELFESNKPHIDGVLEGQSQVFERLIPGPDGVKRHSLAHYVPDIVNGEVVGFLAQVNDVSALKHAEASLLEAQRLGGIGSWEWSPQTDITTWSVELYHILGLDPAKPAPSFAEHPKLYAPESWALLQGAVERALRDGVSYDLELQFLRPDGASGWVDARGEVLLDEARRVVKLRGTVQDITQRRLLTAELAIQHELLKVTLKSIGDGVITTDSLEAVSKKG